MGFTSATKSFVQRNPKKSAAASIIVGAAALYGAIIASVTGQTGQPIYQFKEPVASQTIVEIGSGSGLQDHPEIRITPKTGTAGIVAQSTGGTGTGFCVCANDKDESGFTRMCLNNGIWTGSTVLSC